MPPMRVIRLAERRVNRRGPAVLTALMLTVGGVSSALAVVAPSRRPEVTALLAIVAALALGVGAGILAQLLLRVRPGRPSEDVVRLLARALDDSYLLLVSPRLPGVPADVEALLVGPPGVRALIARRWPGRYRVRGHGWEFDTRSRHGWVPCTTNPTFEGATARAAVVTWANDAGFAHLAIEPAVAFPDRRSHLVLEEPDAEIITTDNVPWWANGMGRVQRLDAERVIAFAESVIEASRAVDGNESQTANRRGLTRRAG
jgi:hypothetical protein